MANEGYEANLSRSYDEEAEDAYVMKHYTIVLCEVCQHRHAPCHTCVYVAYSEGRCQDCLKSPDTCVCDQEDDDDVVYCNCGNAEGSLACKQSYLHKSCLGCHEERLYCICHVVTDPDDLDSHPIDSPRIARRLEQNQHRYPTRVTTIRFDKSGSDIEYRYPTDSDGAPCLDSDGIRYRQMSNAYVRLHKGDRRGHRHGKKLIDARQLAKLDGVHQRREALFSEDQPKASLFEMHIDSQPSSEDDWDDMPDSDSAEREVATREEMAEYWRERRLFAELRVVYGANFDKETAATFEARRLLDLEHRYSLALRNLEKKRYNEPHRNGADRADELLRLRKGLYEIQRHPEKYRGDMKPFVAACRRGLTEFYARFERELPNRFPTFDETDPLEIYEWLRVLIYKY